MLAEKASMDDLKTYTAQNAVPDLSCIKDYVESCFSEKLKNFTYYNLTPHLWMNFQNLMEQVDRLLNQMSDESVSEAYLNNTRESFFARLSAFENSAFAWGCFYMTKAQALPSKKLQLVFAERGMTSVSLHPLNQEKLGDLGTVFANEDWNQIQVSQLQCIASTNGKVLEQKRHK